MFYDPDDLSNRSPEALRRFAGLARNTVLRWHPHVVRGLDRLPAEPVLFVGNHNAGTYMPETYLLGVHLFDTLGHEAIPYGLAHDAVLRLPGINQILCPVGMVRASRDNALRIFAAGHNALVYPGGDLDAVRPFRRRDEVIFGNRRGFARLAIEAGVPIVPFVTAGAHASYVVIDDMRWLARLLRLNRLVRLKVMPLCFSMPLGLTFGPLTPMIPFPTRIHMEVRPPIRFERSGPEAASDDAYVAACAARVLGDMQATLTRLADERRLAMV